jgi:hypothetical protein
MFASNSIGIFCWGKKLNGTELNGFNLFLAFLEDNMTKFIYKDSKNKEEIWTEDWNVENPIPDKVIEIFKKD